MKSNISKETLNGTISRSLHGERGLKSKEVVSVHRGTGRSLHGERGLKYHFFESINRRISRSLHGERGLKYLRRNIEQIEKTSLPSRGAWIEIFVVRAPDAAKTCRSLDGERGLKCRCRSTCKPKRMSLPSRG